MGKQKKAPWARLSDGLETELRQLKEEGRQVDAAFESDVARVLEMEDGAQKDRDAMALFARAQELPYREDAPVEPSDYAEIEKRSQGAARREANHEELLDRIYGGWLARCAGCLLGKPIEGWTMEMIHDLAKAQDNFPIRSYFTSRIPDAFYEKYTARFSKNNRNPFIDRVDGMPEDDDTNYTVIGMKLMGRYGRDFTPEDVCELWMQDLPYYHVCTAERAAYRNFVLRLDVPETATFCNAYREWIGAQIRADAFGYVNPGDPMAAAEMAWRDGCISHVKNGIYGEMWVAAMIAQSFVEDDMRAILRTGLAVVPQRCRLADAVEDVLRWYDEGAPCEAAMERIRARWDEKNGHDWCHTISNAQIVATALIYGEGDLEKTLGIAVTPGFDTDCNAATAGSVLGVKLGAKALPQKWIEPLNDTLYSGVDGFQKTAISELARRTLKLVR